MKKTIALFALMLCLLSAKAQNTAVGPSEKLVYTATYNMSGILNELAQVTMETSAVKTSKATLLRLKCTAATYSKWDSFFKIRDLYESYVSPVSLKPFLYKREINEGGYYKYMKYTFKHSSGQVKSQKKKKRSNGTIWEENKNVSISSNTNDLVTTLYKLRNVDFSNLTKGQSKTFKVIFDNETHTVNFKYLGTETIPSALGTKTCYKLAITISNNNVLKGSHENLLWLTADANKIPLYAKFKIAVGNGELKIKSASGLKH
ncbi:hypothetical protein IA57_11040 [Mangrovimonas yunxiaonensis]|uniref:DUF3108 domain-containing protein n=1 Tax=Mangrovimonas yunxiaonensis TaxID=1197477 RepID=A0A084TJT1_9FLAO|nr:DUF3108 domain-containing protein [Mangrovimonas yunxiaonensis]KFB00967.1 hypothetical protein IA57_11040 [Mangrovimonas yunxiaonensis]GGH43314.1 hypothetical protein GCM10011364_15430 [Mangrovimonas yunxiaonensis]